MFSKVPAKLSAVASLIGVLSTSRLPAATASLDAELSKAPTATLNTTFVITAQEDSPQFCPAPVTKPFEVSSTFMHDALMGKSEIKATLAALVPFKAKLPSDDDMTLREITRIETILNGWGTNGRPAHIAVLSNTNTPPSPSYVGVIGLAQALGKEIRSNLDAMETDSPTEKAARSEKVGLLLRALQWTEKESDRIAEILGDSEPAEDAVESPAAAASPAKTKVATASK